MKQTVKRIFNWCLQYIESGDLILPVVVVSAAHYGVALLDKDFFMIAFVIGVLVDLGHYRTVKAAIKYSRNEKIEWRWWIAALVMTLLAFGFHFAFYNENSESGWKEILFSIAIPVVIVILAALSVRENWAGKVERQIKNENPKIPTEKSIEKNENGFGKMTKKQFIQLPRYAAMTAQELIENYGVSQSTAYRWIQERDAKVIQ